MTGPIAQFKINETLNENVLGIPGVDEHRAGILAELERLEANAKAKG